VLIGEFTQNLRVSEADNQPRDPGKGRDQNDAGHEEARDAVGVLRKKPDRRSQRIDACKHARKPCRRLHQRCLQISGRVDRSKRRSFRWALFYRCSDGDKSTHFRNFFVENRKQARELSARTGLLSCILDLFEIG